MKESISLPQNLQDELVVFYNVENLFDISNDPRTNDDDFTPDGPLKWTETRFKHKIDQLAKVLRNIGDKNPMLVGLVEIENNKVLAELVNHDGLAHTPYKFIHYDSEDKRGIDCAFLYDSSKTACEHNEVIRVRLPEDPSFSTRDILYMKMGFGNQESLHVFVNHWSSRRDGQAITENKRILAALILRNRIDEILRVDSAAKIIVMGDFNDELTDKSILILTGESSLEEKEVLVNLMKGLKSKSVGTLVRNRQWLLYDQLICTKNLLEKNRLHIQNKTAEIYRDESILYTFPNGDTKPNATFGGQSYYGGFSDHLPIFLKLGL